MEIVWLGSSCFRLKSRELTIVTDPHDGKLLLGKQVADVVTVSHNRAGQSYTTDVSAQPKVIAGPGEFEIRGVFITGIQTYRDNEGGKKLGKNVVYLFEMDDLVLCHLGDLGHPLTPAHAEAMSSVDVLLVPVGGPGILTIPQAAEVIGLIEPKITIPMPHPGQGDGGTGEPVERFFRELGEKIPEPQPKLTLNKSQLPQQAQIVLLEARRQ